MEQTSHRVVTLAGHVDHGKSTLVASLTGMATDRLEDERRRGLTIDLGFTWHTLPPTADHPGPITLALIDVPGHERFVATMVAGAGSASAAILVCAADEGPSVQTIEHLSILRLLELPLLAVALTKADRVSEERLTACELEIGSLLSDASYEDVPTVAVDARDPEQLVGLLSTMRQRIAVLPPPVSDRRARLWIDRAFSVDGAGTIVTGTLAGGTLRVGDGAWVLPAGCEARVRRLQSLGSDIDAARPGTRVAVNLGGVSRTGIGRGDTLESHPRARGPGLGVTSIVDAVIWGASPELSDADLRSAQRLHIGTAAIGCRVRPLAPDVPGGRTDRGVPDLPAGAIAVRIRAEAALPLRVGDRLLLTGTGAQRVLAGGIICDPQPVTPRGRTARARHVNTLLAIGAAVRNGDADALVHGLLASHGGFRGLEELRETLGLDADAPVTVPGTLTLGEAVALSDRLEGLAEALASLGPHVHSPDELGDVLITLGLPRRAVGAIMDHLVAVGLIRRTALGLVVEHHADAAESARSSRYAAVVQRIEASPFDPPDFRRVADEEGLDHRERVQLLASDRVVRCGELVIGSAAFARAIDVLRQLDGDGNGFTAAQARDALGSTRRVTVPILEEMLRRGLTRFDGTRHTLARVPD